ncbi:MAG: hypothetical protein N3G80_00110 [Candidatus Micrarchaeota archaeon]|nr:hypothetical protein [Candidatus Micrarchaeota archaeon]
MVEKESLPFSERYSLPVQLSQNLGELSWETVVQLSTDFQIKVEKKTGKLRKIAKELELSRLLLLEKIKAAKAGERIDPQILVDMVKLLQRCEEVTKEYEIDLRDFSTFLYLVIEKLKKERLAKYEGKRAISEICPMKNEFLLFKERGEVGQKKRKRKGRK